MEKTHRAMNTSVTTVRYALADPGEFGLDPVKLEALGARARREVDDGLLPSCQLAVARNGRLVHHETIGAAAPNSRYVIFSTTKAVVAAAIWLLVDESRLRWNDLVVDHVPEFGSHGKDAITIEQLLTHTSGFPNAPLGPLAGASGAGRVVRFAQWRLNWAPGTRFEYHPTSAHWVLAEIIERASGEDYRKFIHSRLFDKLGLTSFRLGDPPASQADINELVAVGTAPTPAEVEEAIGIKIDLATLVGDVTTENLLMFNRPEVREVGVPGAGGISTAADIALFYQAILHNRDRIWNPDTIAAGTEVIVDFPDPIRLIPSNRSRGLMVAGEAPDSVKRGFGHGASPRTFGHNGAGGQIAWADPDSGISFCYLTNGLDQNVIREARRSIGLSSRAAVCLKG